MPLYAPRCPYCFSKIESDTITSSFTNDPILQPNGIKKWFNPTTNLFMDVDFDCNKGFTVIQNKHIKELQDLYDDYKPEVTDEKPDGWTPVEDDSNGLWVPNKQHIKELRDAIERALGIAESTSEEDRASLLEQYFNYDEDGVERKTPHQTDWTDPNLTDAIWQGSISHMHIEDLRHYLSISDWLNQEGYWGSTPFQLLDTVSTHDFYTTERPEFKYPITHHLWTASIDWTYTTEAANRAIITLLANDISLMNWVGWWDGTGHSPSQRLTLQTKSFPVLSVGIPAIGINDKSKLHFAWNPATSLSDPLVTSRVWHLDIQLQSVLSGAGEKTFLLRYEGKDGLPVAQTQFNPENSDILISIGTKADDNTNQMRTLYNDISGNSEIMKFYNGTTDTKGVKLIGAQLQLYCYASWNPGEMVASVLYFREIDINYYARGT